MQIDARKKILHLIFIKQQNHANELQICGFVVLERDIMFDI